MIGSVGCNSKINSLTVNSRRQSFGANFKEEYAKRANQDQVSFSNQNVSTRSYCEIGPSIESMTRYMNSMNTQATGGAKLTDEEIKELKEKYNFNNMSSDDRLNLLLELNQKNVISYSTISASTRLTVEFTPKEAESFVQAMRQKPGFEDFDMPTENIAKKNEALTVKLPPAYHYNPQNIYEEYANLTMEWRAKYQAALEQYDEERPEYLKRADAYSDIADILKSIMED